MHPRYGVPKTYVARVRGKVSRRALGTLRQGVDLEDGLTSPADVRLKKQSAKTALVEITIHEGRKRQVRRMFVAVGLPVEELQPAPLRPADGQGPGARRLPRAHRRRGRGAAPGRGRGGRRGRQGGRRLAPDAGRGGAGGAPRTPSLHAAPTRSTTRPTPSDAERRTRGEAQPSRPARPGRCRRPSPSRASRRTTTAAGRRRLKCILLQAKCTVRRPPAAPRRLGVTT